MIFHSHNKLDIVDIQNASLSGGVAVGAIADLMIQPYGAFFMGSLCGVVSTLGYRILMVQKIYKLFKKDIRSFSRCLGA